MTPFFLRSSYFSRYSRNSPLFMKPKGLFSCLQKPTTCLYLEQDDFNLHPCTPSHQNQLFSFTPLSTPRSSKFSFRCRFYDQCFVWIVQLPHGYCVSAFYRTNFSVFTLRMSERSVQYADEQLYLQERL